MARSKKVRSLLEVRKQLKKAQSTERKLRNKVEEGYTGLSVPERTEYNQLLRNDVMGWDEENEDDPA